jgi:hypothetical protein
MPAVILTNICSSLGQVNGSRGNTAGVVIDPTGMFSYYEILRNI